jgi:hypothetical protein
MDAFLSALALSMLPALGYVIGGFIAELVRISDKTISFALHVAAGAIFAVISVELMPQVLQTQPAWAFIMAFVAGGVFYAAMDRSLRLIARVHGSTKPVSGWAVLLGVAVELLNDGIMVGIGSTVNLGLGLILALGQLPGEHPRSVCYHFPVQEPGPGPAIQGTAVCRFHPAGAGRHGRRLLADQRTAHHCKISHPRVHRRRADDAGSGGDHPAGPQGWGKRDWLRSSSSSGLRCSLLSRHMLND